MYLLSVHSRFIYKKKSVYYIYIYIYTSWNTTVLFLKLVWTNYTFLLVLHTLGPFRVLKTPGCLFVFQHWWLGFDFIHPISTTILLQQVFSCPQPYILMQLHIFMWLAPKTILRNVRVIREFEIWIVHLVITKVVICFVICSSSFTISSLQHLK